MFFVDGCNAQTFTLVNQLHVNVFFRRPDLLIHPRGKRNKFEHQTVTISTGMIYRELFTKKRTRKRIFSLIFTATFFNSALKLLRPHLLCSEVAFAFTLTQCECILNHLTHLRDPSLSSLNHLYLFTKSNCSSCKQAADALKVNNISI